MKRTKQLLFFVGLFSLVSCSNEETVADLEGLENYASETGCLADSSWFVEVDGRRLTPAPNEGSTSPFANNVTVTNCDFHQWSWQKFLWLTNEDANGTPSFMDKSSFHRVTPHGGLIHADMLQLSSIAQASGSNDSLTTPNDPTSTVYYSIFMNDLMYNTMIKYGNTANLNPDSLTNVSFPVGSVELKASWVEASSIGATSTDYYITDAKIGSNTVQVALLGLHVVGIVENHPEFVWATFEHDGLAPKYNWEDAKEDQDATVTSSTGYPLFAANATGTVNNISSKTLSHKNIFSVYEFGVPVKKVGDSVVFMETSQDGAENVEHITSINADVKSQLTGKWNNYFYNGSLWIDTEGSSTPSEQADLINSKGYNLSNSAPGELTRGSVAEYNLTMETYVQVGFSPSSIYADTNAANLTNCFSCHSSPRGDNLSPLYISHVFTKHADSLNGMSAEEIKQSHVDEIIEHFKLRAKANK